MALAAVVGMAPMEVMEGLGGRLTSPTEFVPRAPLASILLTLAAKEDSVEPAEAEGREATEGLAEKVEERQPRPVVPAGFPDMALDRVGQGKVGSYKVRPAIMASRVHAAPRRSSLRYLAEAGAAMTTQLFHVPIA